MSQFVMAGLVPAVHVLDAARRKTWMPGTSPGMTEDGSYTCFAAKFSTFTPSRSSMISAIHCRWHC
jgi:hypothetical protein